MQTDRLTSDWFDPPPPKEILDALPFGISIQTIDFEVIFENSFFQEVMGVRADKYCYSRWADFEEYGKGMCKDCPTQITTHDNQKHKILRKMIDIHGTERFVEVTHIPIMNQNNEFNRFIEIVEDVSEETNRRLVRLENMEVVQQDIFLSLLNFGDFGGNIVRKQEIPFVEDLDTFLKRLSIFWYTAIGQGSHWHNGFFGPLPVFDYTEYDSLTFSFQVDNPELQDERFKGKDYILLIMIIRKEISTAFEDRSATIELFEKLFEPYKSIEDLKILDLNDLKNQLIEYISNSA